MNQILATTVTHEHSPVYFFRALAHSLILLGYLPHKAETEIGVPEFRVVPVTER